MTRQVGPARQILRKLFNGSPVSFTPAIDEAELRYEFKGTAAIGGLVTGHAKAVVSPTGKPSTGRVVLPFRFRVVVDAA